jgi:glycerol-3-phosphate dehydrogenase
MGKESQTFRCRSSALARRKNVVTPVMDEVDAMLYEGKDVRQAVQDLTARESKAED